MAISRVPGYSLLANLDRQGTDLALTSAGPTLQYWDVVNYRIGVNTDSPQQALHVNGNVLIANGHVYTDANITYDIGTINNQWRTGYFNNVAGTIITPAQPNITTVGDLVNLTVLGNLTVNGTSFANVSTTGNLNAGNNRVIYVATPIESSDAANKAYVDTAITGGAQGNLIPLGTPTDANLAGNNAAYLGFTTSTTVTDAIDILNSVTQNLFTNTFVRSVSFSSNVTAGGAGQTILLTMVPQGNVNQYTIQWGDGSANTVTSSASVAHTYATNVGTPFTVIVNATNTNGASPSNVANAVRTNYITIYGADPGMGFSMFRANISSTPLSGNSLYSIAGNVIYLQNTTTNTNTATVTWSLNWGDGTYANVPNNSSAGGVLGPYANKTYTANSGSSSFTVNLALLTSDITNPAIIPRYTSTNLKVYATVPPIPNGTVTRSLTYGTSVGTNPYLASGVTDNTGGTTLTVGAAVNRATFNQAIVNANAGTIASTLTYNGNAGVLTALVNGTDAGNVNFANPQTTGLYGNLWITTLSDYNLYSQTGSAVAFASSIYYPGWGYGFTANVTSTGSKLPLGVNRFGIIHTTTGRTSNADFVVDEVTSVPTVSGGNIAIKAPGTYRYISGIPYFNTGSPQLWLQDLTISSWIGQTYNNTANVAFVNSGTNLEGTTGNVILANTHAYVNLSNVSSPMLATGTPITGTGNVAAYNLANLTVAINQASVRAVANVQVVATNVNGTSTARNVNVKRIQVHTAAQNGISEISVNVSASLGNGAITSNGIRSTYFLSSTTNTPTYVGSTNFYTANVYSESSDPGVAGTKEATLRIGTIKHDLTDYGNIFLPVGPNRSSDTGVQYFTFAFRRFVVANFDINVTAPTGVQGVWIAAPGTTIDSTSGINGWLDCSTAYAGSGVPGSDTGNGGNGSNGCALTTGDRIQANTALSGGYTMTLGTENMTNATNQTVLVRIGLNSGQTITALSVGVAT